MLIIYKRIIECHNFLQNEVFYHGICNVAEWCWDWYTDYGSEDIEQHSYFKVVRGGSYKSSVRELTVYAREGVFPDALYNRGIGIRVVRTKVN